MLGERERMERGNNGALHFTAQDRVMVVVVGVATVIG